MIQFIPPTPRRRWPGVLLLAILLTVIVFIAVSCVSVNADESEPVVERHLTLVQ